MARYVLKLSGEGLGGNADMGADPAAVRRIATSIADAARAGNELAVVVGGGNYFRGGRADEWDLPRAELDNVGVLGTVMNGIFLRGALSAAGCDVRLMTAVPIPSVAEPYIRLRADSHLRKGRVVVLAGGNGQPFVTTDYPSVQRAVELDADRLLVAKNGAEGVMTADPRLDPTATLLHTTTYDHILAHRLRVMDQAAFVLAMEQSIPLQVFDANRIDTLTAICAGDAIGTTIQP